MVGNELPAVVPFEFVVPGEPTTQGSMRAILNRHTHRPVLIADNRKALMAWRKVAQQAALTGKAGATDKFFSAGIPVRVAATFVCAKPSRPQNAYPPKDIDKLSRALLDALTGVVIADDSQVVELLVRKTYGTSPRTRVVVTRA